jgi:hypothetical protein
MHRNDSKKYKARKRRAHRLNPGKGPALPGKQIQRSITDIFDDLSVVVARELKLMA